MKDAEKPVEVSAVTVSEIGVNETTNDSTKLLAAVDVADAGPEKEHKLSVKEQQSSENTSGVNRSPNLTEQS